MTWTADICDAHPTHAKVLPGPWQSLGAHRVFEGPIRTAKCFEDNSQVKAMLAEPGHGAVLVVDGGGSLRAALLGGNLAKLAAQNGWAGVLIHGAVRDSHEIAAEPLGVRARGTCPTKSIKRGAGERDVVVEIGGEPISPGMWLYADDDGVVLMPAKA